MLGDETSASWRHGVVAGVSGRVLEVGFGSGRTLGSYSDSVCCVLAVEPSPLAWERATDRVAAFRATGRDVEHVGIDGAILDVPDNTVDAVVSTWTMCTIPDLTSALGEFARVLRPGGRVHFVEHTVSPRPWVARAERIVQPVWGTFAGGCHLDRDIEGLLTDHGYAVDINRSAGFYRAGTAAPPSL